MPFLSLCAAAAKIWLYQCPIDEGFGLISVLAAIRPDSLSQPKGAGLSGRLTRRVGVDISLVATDNYGNASSKIDICLDRGSKQSKIKRRVIYS